MKLISKEVSRAEPEYMNIHPPPPPPISVLATALLTKLQVTLTKLQVTPTKLQVTRSKLTSLTAETNKSQLTNMLFITF